MSSGANERRMFRGMRQTLLSRGATHRPAPTRPELRAGHAPGSRAGQPAPLLASHRVSALADLPLLASGKVRELYDLGGAEDARLLMVASDRISTYDAVHPTPIPDKGRVLSGLSVFWFEQTRHIVANHLISATEGVPPEARGRALVVRRLE